MGHIQDSSGRKCPLLKHSYFIFLRGNHVTFCYSVKICDKKCYNMLTCTLRRVLSEEEIVGSETK
jgi:hypothetical protein